MISHGSLAETFGKELASCRMLLCRSKCKDAVARKDGELIIPVILRKAGIEAVDLFEAIDV